MKQSGRTARHGQAVVTRQTKAVVQEIVEVLAEPAIAAVDDPVRVANVKRVRRGAS